jgi:hypothetical protein
MKENLTLTSMFSRIHLINHFTGIWPYPFLRHLNTCTRSIFLLGVLCLTALIYKIGELINHVIWIYARSDNKKGKDDYLEVNV